MLQGAESLPDSIAKEKRATEIVHRIQLQIITDYVSIVICHILADAVHYITKSPVSANIKFRRGKYGISG